MTSNSHRCPVCGTPAELPSTAACHREAAVQQCVHAALSWPWNRPPQASLELLQRQPPATGGTSHNPAHLNASPIACAPVAQAVATAWLGPCRPCAMLTAPAAMLTRVLGTKKGLSRRTLPSACAASAAEPHTELGRAWHRQAPRPADKHKQQRWAAAAAGAEPHQQHPCVCHVCCAAHASAYRHPGGLPLLWRLRPPARILQSL